jgi:biotin-dependent carboxylase-like uncharacterized protein
VSLTVLKPGVGARLVDAGRPGHRSLGVPVGGPADRAAWMLGNALVGNRPDAVALEVAVAGPVLRADHPTVAVLFGAPFPRAGVTFRLAPGEVLAVGGTPAGVRAYLCVAGGFDGPVVLGSRSGLDPIRAGDVLPCPPSAGPVGRSLPGLTSWSVLTAHPPANPTTLHALDGPQADWFAPGFFGREYTVSPASDRMGVRLTGEPLDRRPGELVSEPVAPGAVQVTNDGRPVVLGVDGQTIGGYPKVAHVVRADLDRLGQLRPGERVVFQRATPDEAEELARCRAAALRRWLIRLRA